MAVKKRVLPGVPIAPDVPQAEGEPPKRSLTVQPLPAMPPLADMPKPKAPVVGPDIVGQAAPLTPGVNYRLPQPTPPSQPAAQPTPVGKAEFPQLDVPPVPTLDEQFAQIRDLFKQQGGSDDGLGIIDKAMAAIAPVLQGGQPDRLVAGDAVTGMVKSTELSLRGFIREQWGQQPTRPGLSDPKYQALLERLSEAERENLSLLGTDPALDAYMADLSAYTAQYQTWMSGLSGSLQAQTQARLFELDQVMGFLKSTLELRSDRDIEAIQQQGVLAQQVLGQTFQQQQQSREQQFVFALNERNAELASLQSADAAQRQLDFMKQELASQKELLGLQTQQTITITQKTHELNLDRLKVEQDYDREQQALNRAIRTAELEEVVRHSRAQESLEARRVDLEEQAQQLSFLGSLLSNSGLGLFTLAMLSPEAAQTAVSRGLGTPVGSFTSPALSNPLQAAGTVRAQQAEFGEASIPSIQQLVRSSPQSQLFTQQAFQLEGRDLPTEVANLTPTSVAARRTPRR